MPSSSPTLDAAIRALELGFWPVAIYPHGSKDSAEGKRPIGKGWGKDRPTIDSLRSTWKRFPKAGVGLLLGPMGGVIDIDVDGPGPEADRALARIFGEIPATAAYASTGDRYHLLFRWRPELGQLPSVVKSDPRKPNQKFHPEYPGLELRFGGAGALQLQSVIPPSADATGKPRIWYPDRALELIAPLPDRALADFLTNLAVEEQEKAAPAPRPARLSPATSGGTREEKYALAAFAAEIEKVASAAEGGRNDQLNLSAVALGELIASGHLGRTAVEQALTEAAEACGLGRDKNCGPSQIERTIRSGIDYGSKHPRDVRAVIERTPSKVDHAVEAAELLREMLKDGARPAAEVKAFLNSHGYSTRAIHRACNLAGVVGRRNGFGGDVEWVFGATNGDGAHSLRATNGGVDHTLRATNGEHSEEDGSVSHSLRATNGTGHQSLRATNGEHSEEDGSVIRIWRATNGDLPSQSELGDDNGSDKREDRGGGNGKVPPPPTEPPGPEPRRRSDDPHLLAKHILRGFEHADGLTVRRWRGEWREWSEGVWKDLSDEEVASFVTARCRQLLDQWEAIDDKGNPVRVTGRLVSDVCNALRSMALLKADHCPREPGWLDNRESPDPREVIATPRGLVVLPAAAAQGESEAYLPPTPLYWSRNRLDFDYDPSAPEPMAWLDFLDSVWGEDPEAIQALQEWFGYLLTPDTSRHKILMILGPKRSGKGTIVRTIAQLLGEGNYCTPTLRDYAEKFDMTAMIGKLAAIVTDARISGKTDKSAVVERMLSISGEEPQLIARKYKDAWQGRLLTRIVICSNEAPHLVDQSGALSSRVIMLRMKRSFLGREDRTLEKRIKECLPGVLNWAIEGWGALQAREQLTQPTSGRRLLQQLEKTSASITSFVEECCELDSQVEYPADELFEAWKKWAGAWGIPPGTRNTFTRDLASSFQIETSENARHYRGRRTYFYKGIALAAVEPLLSGDKPPGSAF